MTVARFLGTPHFNRLAIAGEGVDCVNLVMEILIGAGIVERTRLPFYDERLGALRRRNVIEDIVMTHLHVDRIDPQEDPAFGDVVICRCGRQTNHVGMIMAGDPVMMVHVPAEGFVSLEDWTVWRHRAQSLLRIRAPGYRADPSKLTWQAVRGMADLPNVVE